MTDPGIPTETLGAWRAAVLCVWAAASFGLVYFAHDLQWVVFGWPLSFWLSAQGIVLFFVLIVCVYAWGANRAEAREELHAADVGEGGRP